MFIGHFAVAFAAKRAEPSASLGTYVAAAQLPDLLWPVLLLAGVERATIAPGDTAFTPLRFDSYPVSHSLLTDVAWALLVAAAYRWRTGRTRALPWIAALVVSHWVLDFVTHRPDLPLVPGFPPKVGLGLWNSVAGTLLVEGAMFVAGVWMYLARSRPLDAIGRYGLGAFVAVLVVFYLGAAFGPPPPDTRALALSAAAMWLLVAWAAWADRHRRGDSGVKAPGVTP